jgi:hypothetical protein
VNPLLQQELLMIPLKKLIDNELIKEIVAIRVDTLWKMLGQQQAGYLPGTMEEGATGKLDNKGAIFIPGGLIYQDVDERLIDYDRHGEISAAAFREKIHGAMQYDNATLLFPDGIATGINLDSGFFSRAARRIYTFKKAAFRRKPKIGAPRHLNVDSDDIIRSHCPTYLPPPYGARTRISTAAAVGLIDSPLYFAYCGTQFNLARDQAERFARRLDAAQDAVESKDGTILFPPNIIVCHDTRYKPNNLTGLTRILGIGKFGEFATFTFESVNTSLNRELDRKQTVFNDEDIFAEHNDVQVLGILRVYLPTNPGKRSLRYDLHVVSPARHFELDLGALKQAAFDRYPLRLEGTV